MPDNQQWVEQLSRDVELLSSKIHTLEVHQARLGREAERLRNQILAGPDRGHVSPTTPQR